MALGPSRGRTVEEPAVRTGDEGGQATGQAVTYLAFGLEQTSRLGCQIVMTKELDGLVVRLPAGTRNMMG